MATPAQLAQIIPQARPGPRGFSPGSAPAGAEKAPAQAPSVSVCNVLREDPELAAGVPAPRRREALERCTAPATTITAPTSLAASLLSDGGGIGLLILDGLLVRRVWIDGRSGADLLGEGDLLGPNRRL